MARIASNVSVADVIDESVQSVVARVLPSIQRALDAAVDARVRAELGSRSAFRGRRAASPRRSGEMTRWVADNRARRVPTFVIEATGLDTKKKIVAKYGENAAFAKGKPLPPVKLAAAKPQEAQPLAAREVKARAPIVRKAATSK
jgi:hypothetical protein